MLQVKIKTHNAPVQDPKGVLLLRLADCFAWSLVLGGAAATPSTPYVWTPFPPGPTAGWAFDDQIPLVVLYCSWSTNHAVITGIFLARGRRISEESLQEWGKVPTANAYADGQMSVPSA
jgi:hypothetical protein